MIEKRKSFKRKPYRQREQDEFEQRIVDLRRVTRVMAGGKRMRFRACVVIGDHKGQIGYGLAKGKDVAIAVNKAVSQAKNRLVKLEIVNDTIAHQVVKKYKAALVVFRPAPDGTGIIAGGAVRAVLELSGIKNISAKILGSNNKVNIVKAVFEALTDLKKRPARLTACLRAPHRQASVAQAGNTTHPPAVRAGSVTGGESSILRSKASVEDRKEGNAKVNTTASSGVPPQAVANDTPLSSKAPACAPRAGRSDGLKKEEKKPIAVKPVVKQPPARNAAHNAAGGAVKEKAEPSPQAASRVSGQVAKAKDGKKDK